MRPTPSRRARRVAVVVPAHDEELLLPACLRSISAAARCSPVPVEVFVVADACRDSTAEVARSAAGTVPTILDVDLRNVGLARAAGLDLAIGRSGPDDLLVLCTDADSTVPVDWIARHLEHVRRGADLVVGTVLPSDWQHWPRGVAREYRRRYRADVRSGAHGHIHGANLGMVATSYLGLGGFSGLATGEDVHLVGVARAAGLCVVFAADLAVRTSTRALGRAPDGFSAHLRSLAGTGRTG